MFECKYKFELEDSITSAKYVYKSQRRKRDVVIAVMLPILILVMVGLLILDIVKGKNLVWDIVLLSVLVVLQVLYLVIPLTIVNQQKKSYKKQNLAAMDQLVITIDNSGLCTETLYKDGQEVAKSAHGLRALTSYIEDNNRLILVFNKIEFVCIRKDCLTGGLDKLKAYLEKCMKKTAKSKK